VRLGSIFGARQQRIKQDWIFFVLRFYTAAENGPITGNRKRHEEKPEVVKDAGSVHVS